MATSVEATQRASVSIMNSITTAAAATEADTNTAIISDELLRISRNIKTIIPNRTWVSLGSEKEVMAEKSGVVDAIPPRPLLKVHFDVSRQVLLRHHSMHLGYINKEASEDSRDLRSTTNPLYNLVRDEVDVGVQAVPEVKQVASQTYFARKVNAVVQAEPALVDACVYHMDVPRKESPALGSFLSKAIPRITHCLTQNYEVPIYTDDYLLFKEDDAIVGTRDEMTLLEKGNYMHSTMKDRTISCIGWRSGNRKDSSICVASIAVGTLEKRLNAERRCESSVSLVWNFADPMHPRYILESTSEVQALQFSPARPNLVAGGGMNGQVFLWDLSIADATPPSPSGAGSVTATMGGGKMINSAAAAAATNSTTLLSRSENNAAAAATTMHSNTNSTNDDANNAVRLTTSPDDDNAQSALSIELPPLPRSISNLSFDMDGDVLVPRLQPIQISRLELSHRRPVHDLKWLPDNLECTFDGKQTVVEASHQFMTLSDDGSVCVWDTRASYLPPDKMRKFKHQMKCGAQDTLWVPLHRYPLTRTEDSGNGSGPAFAPANSIANTAIGSTTGTSNLMHVGATLSTRTGLTGGGAGDGFSKPGSGLQDLMGYRFDVGGLTPNDDPSYVVAVATTDGCIAHCSMVARQGSNNTNSNTNDANINNNNNNNTSALLVGAFGTTKETRFVREVVSAAHAGCVYSIQRHPLFGDVYLSCGDHCFKVWRRGLPRPLYRSPNMESGVTCAAWSPTRPAMVFIGTRDGKIMLWDLLDRNQEPQLVHHMVQDAITSLSFKPLPRRLSQSFMQQLAIGTHLGSFHWYVLPTILSRAPNGERRHMRAMLEREAERAVYYLWRSEVRQRELSSYGANVAPQMSAMITSTGKRAHAGVTGNENHNVGSNSRPAGVGEDYTAENETTENEQEETDERGNFYAYDAHRDGEFLEQIKSMREIEESVRLHSLA